MGEVIIGREAILKALISETKRDLDAAKALYEEAVRVHRDAQETYDEEFGPTWRKLMWEPANG